MPVTRCPHCQRGLAGYLGREKGLWELDLDEIRSEIAKYEAKEIRIKAFMAGLEDAPPADYPDGRVCPGCAHGWREFKNHRKDLAQLTAKEARAALGANSRYLKKLYGRIETGTSQHKGEGDSLA